METQTGGMWPVLAMRFKTSFEVWKQGIFPDAKEDEVGFKTSFEVWKRTGHKRGGCRVLDLKLPLRYGNRMRSSVFISVPPI